MIDFPNQINPRVYRPEDDPRYGLRGGLTVPAKTIKYESDVEWMQNHGRKLPGYDRVMARLKRTGENR